MLKNLLVFKSNIINNIIAKNIRILSEWALYFDFLCIKIELHQIQRDVTTITNLHKLDKIFAFDKKKKQSLGRNYMKLSTMIAHLRLILSYKNLLCTYNNLISLLRLPAYMLFVSIGTSSFGSLLSY